MPRPAAASARRTPSGTRFGPRGGRARGLGRSLLELDSLAQRGFGAGYASGLRLATGFSGLFNRHAMPESDITLDVRRGGLDVRVVPRRVLVDLAVHNDVVVARRPLPATHSVRFARAQMLVLDRFGRKVLVAFDRLAGVALGDHLTVPDCSCHLGLLGRSGCDLSSSAVGGL